MIYEQLSKDELISELMEIQQKHDSYKTAVEKGLAEKEKEKLILEKLINASEEFIQFRNETPNYDSILQTILDISGAKYAILNIFDDNGLDFSTVAIAGIAENIKKALALLGFNVINNHWKHDPIRAVKTDYQTITRFRQLHELTGDTVSNNVIRLIEKTFSIGETFVVKISKENQVLGDFTLLFQKGETMSNDKFVDLYAHQVGMFLDKKKAINLLHDTEARHSTMISNISDVITIIDANGILTYRSPNCERWFGWQPNELIGTSGWSTVHPDDLVRIQKEFNTLLEEDNSTKAVEYRYKCRDGSYKLIGLTATNLTNDPVIKGVLLNYHDITERKNTENLIFKTNILLNAILESSPEVIVFALDREYRYLTFNSKHKTVIQQIWGKEITIGMSMLDVIGNHDDRVNAKANFDRALAGESFVLSEDYGNEKLSRLSWLDYWSPIHDDAMNVTGLTCFVLNITERKRAEEALQESEAELKMAQRMAQMGSWTLENTTNQVKWTEGLYRMLGLDPNQSPPNYNDQHILFTSESWSLLSTALSNTRKTGIPYELELEMVRPDGTTGWMLAFGEAVRDTSGIITGLRGAAQDITTRKQAETELILKNEQLQTLNSTKDKFFSIIAHDLRSPFNSFLGLTQIMAEELPSLTMSQLKEITVSMSKSATNLYRLLENLLQWSRMQQGAIPFNPETIQLSSIVDESIEMIQEAAKSKGIEIVTAIPDGLTVFADTNLFQTVVRNLVSNAVKFTPKGGKVNVSAKITDDKNIEISIRDTGIGMSQTMINNLFRIDIQTSRKGTEGEPSTGLGLLLCKEFVERHGGKIWAESEEGKGSTFKFTIPKKYDLFYV